MFVDIFLGETWFGRPLVAASEHSAARPHSRERGEVSRVSFCMFLYASDGAEFKFVLEAVSSLALVLRVFFMICIRFKSFSLCLLCKGTTGLDENVCLDGQALFLREAGFRSVAFTL